MRTGRRSRPWTSSCRASAKLLAAPSASTAGLEERAVCGPEPRGHQGYGELRQRGSVPHAGFDRASTVTCSLGRRNIDDGSLRGRQTSLPGAAPVHSPLGRVRAERADVSAFRQRRGRGAPRGRGASTCGAPRGPRRCTSCRRGATVASSSSRGPEPVDGEPINSASSIASSSSSPVARTA